MEFRYDDIIEKTIISELINSFYGLGIDVKDIKVNIDSESLNLVINLQS